MADRKEEVTALGRKLNEARLGEAEKWPSALDLHLAVVALNYVAETAEYEYNIERTSLDFGNAHVWFDVWMTKDEAEDSLAGYNEAEEEHEVEFGHRYATYRMVKRRKAGPVEDA